MYDLWIGYANERGEGLTMDWKAEALARVRRARLHASSLSHEIGDVGYSLRKLEYWDEDALMTDAMDALKCMIDDLFKLEGRLSQS